MKTLRLNSGDIIPPGYFGDFWDDVRACEISGGPGIRVTRTPNGTIVSAIRQPSGGSGAQGERSRLECWYQDRRTVTARRYGARSRSIRTAHGRPPGEEVPVIVPLLK